MDYLNSATNKCIYVTLVYLIEVGLPPTLKIPLFGNRCTKIHVFKDITSIKNHSSLYKSRLIKAWHIAGKVDLRHLNTEGHLLVLWLLRSGFHTS